MAGHVLADLRVSYYQHLGAASGTRRVTFTLHPDDLEAFANIETLRDEGILRLRLMTVDRDWTPPKARKPRFEAPTVREGPEGIEDLEVAVKRQALLAAMEVLQKGTDEQRLRILGRLSSLTARDADDDADARKVHEEFEALIARMVTDDA